MNKIIMTIRQFWQKTVGRLRGQVASSQDSQNLRRGLAAVSDESHALQAELDNVRQLLVQTGDEGSRKLAELQQQLEQAVADQEQVHHQIRGLQGTLEDAQTRQDKAESRVVELETELTQEHNRQLGLIQQLEGRERALELRTGRAIWVASAALLLVAISSAAVMWGIYNNNRILSDLGSDIHDIKLSMAQPPAQSLKAPPVEADDTPPAVVTMPPATVPDTYQSQEAEPDEVIELLPVPSVINPAGSANQSRIYTKREDARQFFADNALQPGVITLQSGLQYRIISEGVGRMPTLSDSVLVDYRAFLLDGSEFDSPDQEPGENVFAMDEVIPGWKEALLRMEEGAQWEIYIPANLTRKRGIRKRGMLGFKPLIYIIELKAIVDAEVSGQDQ